VRSFGRIVHNPCDPIDLVSDQLVFSSPSAMARTWRAEAGVTPGVAAMAIRGHRLDASDASLLVAARIVDRVAGTADAA